VNEPLAQRALTKFYLLFKQEEGTAVYRYVERLLIPRAAKATAKFDRKIRIAANDPTGAKRLKKKTNHKIKQEIKEKLESLSKRVCFYLGGINIDTKYGKCYTCSSIDVLQWGHYVRQNDCPWIVYHPHQSRPQCAQCNGFGKGMQVEFHRALEQEKAGRADNLLSLQSKYGKKKPTAADLEYIYKMLKAYADQKGIP